MMIVWHDLYLPPINLWNLPLLAGNASFAEQNKSIVTIISISEQRNLYNLVREWR